MEKIVTGEVFEDFSLVRHKFSVVDIYIPPAKVGECQFHLHPSSAFVIHCILVFHYVRL